MRIDFFVGNNGLMLIFFFFFNLLIADQSDECPFFPLLFLLFCGGFNLEIIVCDFFSLTFTTVAKKENLLLAAYLTNSRRKNT